MKDFFKEYWKIAAGCAAGAFLLSFLIGLISRNPFAIVLLRAVLLALLFAGLGIGLRYVVRRYLPEVNVGEKPAPDTAERGKRVDITLPEEDGVTGQQVRAEGQQNRAERSSSPAGLSDAEREAAEQAEAQALGDIAQDLGEDIGPADVDEAESVSALGEEEQDVPAEYTESDSGAESVATLDAGRSRDEDLDSLPDISALEPDPDLGPRESAARPTRRGNGGDRPQDAMKGALSGQDPATLARAIRTVLSKDEKG